MIGSLTQNPTEIRLKEDRKSLIVVFGDDQSFDLSAEYLRIMSPSAEVQGHSPEQRKIVSGKINVEILTVEPIGNYAVKLTFDDMHNTGIYSWSYLRELGEYFEENWQNYLTELEQHGLKRTLS